MRLLTGYLKEGEYSCIHSDVAMGPFSALFTNNDGGPSLGGKIMTAWRLLNSPFGVLKHPYYTIQFTYRSSGKHEYRHPSALHGKKTATPLGIAVLRLVSAFDLN